MCDGWDVHEDEVGPQSDAPAQAGLEGAAWAGTVLVDYARYLDAERGLSVHTCRAYLGDIRALLGYLGRSRGVTALSEIELGDLRGWLAAMSRESSAARTSVARRAASARTFFRWATRTGRISVDPSLRLVAPRRTGHLPGVLRQSEATELMAVAGARS
jgi:integrase/recombinase XerC